MLDQARQGSDAEQAAPAQVHVGPSPELQRLARTVVSDQAATAQAGTAAGQVELPHRAAMEARFGQSFADVHVQIDPVAASAVGARAYTMGRNIVFASSNPEPELVAHELTHVVQQRQGRARDVEKKYEDTLDVASPNKK